MKTIIHFHPNWNYADKFISPLIKAEEEIGYESQLVTALNNPINNLQIDFQILKTPYKLPVIIFKLVKLLYINRPDIVFCHNTTSSVLPLIIARILFIKNIIYFNHGVPFIGYQGFFRYFLRGLEKINCALSTNIITVSNEMRLILGNITKKKIEIINNGSACGIDLEKNKNEKINVTKLKKKLNFGLKDKIFLFIGRPNKRKGFHDVIKIWEKKFIFNKNFKLILLGIDSVDFKKINKTIPKNVFPLSFVKNIDDYHFMADYFFMTSHHEGLNYSVLESFYFKTIVLSNNIPSVLELVNDRETGFLINKNCPKNFYDIVNECEKNINLKRKIVKNASKVVTKYDRKKFMKNYKKFLEQF